MLAWPRDSWICSSLPPFMASLANVRPCARSGAARVDLALGEHRERDADKHEEQQGDDGEHNQPPLIAPVALETRIERDDRLLPPGNLDSRGEQVPDSPIRRVANRDVLTTDLAGDPLESGATIRELRPST